VELAVDSFEPEVLRFFLPGRGTDMLGSKSVERCVGRILRRKHASELYVALNNYQPQEDGGGNISGGIICEAVLEEAFR
jgi:hypothetical protein